MKQLSTQTFTIIALVAVAILVVGVFAIQDHTKTPTPVVENGEEQENEGKSEEEKGENQDSEYDFSKDLDVSTWKTYESEKVGVRIKYPEDWSVVVLENEKAGFALRSPAYIPIQSGVVTYKGEIYVDNYSNPNQLSIENLFKTFDDGSGAIFSKNVYKDVIVSGLSGVHFPEVVDGRYYNEAYVLMGNRITYSFSYEYLRDQKNPVISEILQKIVESFEPLE